MIKPKFLVFFLLLIVTSITIGQTKSVSLSANRILKINVPLMFVDKQNNTLSKKNIPRNIYVLLPYLPGEIFGNPKSGPIYAGVLQKNSKLFVDLSKSLDLIKNDAKPITQRWSLKGLKAYPENTKIARIGTFVYDAKTKKPMGGGGFIDPKSKDHLVLIYVSQACKIMGNIMLGKESFEHHIELPNSGFNFLRVRVLSSNQYKIEYFPNNGKINFFIRMSNIINM